MSIIPSPLLRQALLADAATSGAFGLLMMLGAGFLEPMLGLPGMLLHIAGFVLLPYAVLLAYLATRQTLPRMAAWAVIGGNALWAIDSALLLVSGWVHPTSAGYAFVIAQAAAVAMYAEFQFMGLRKSSPAIA